MYTCPDPEHADVVSAHSGNCPHGGRGLAAFRGVWLDETMAANNVPANPELADVAAYRCPIHPLVNSDSPGHCTICGAPLKATQTAKRKSEAQRIPANAEYVCSMEEDWYFSAEAGDCPKCGMKLRPIRKVRWAREALATQSAEASSGEYVCPMHPQVKATDHPGRCPLCGMQLVAESAMKRPTAASEHVAAEMDYIIEHYLELQKLLASDRKTGLARQASSLASASQKLMAHVNDPDVNLPSEAVAAAQKLHAAALKITSKSLAADRVAFVDVSAAVRTLVENARPDKNRWPKLYIYNCPMSKGDWIQSTEEKANPYYGFKMLKCGNLQGIK